MWENGLGHLIPEDLDDPCSAESYLRIELARNSLRIYRFTPTLCIDATPEAAAVFSA